MDNCTTGTSAAGNMCASTDQVPWSSPHASKSWPTHRGLTTSATCSASSGRPGAGYWMSSSLGTLAKKSWIVRGRAMAVTAVALMYQCAEMTSTARGRGTVSPRTRHAVV